MDIIINFNGEKKGDSPKLSTPNGERQGDSPKLSTPNGVQKRTATSSWWTPETNFYRLTAGESDLNI